jgi:predicted negative regulator of RcsB-dependent stress response
MACGAIGIILIILGTYSPVADFGFVWDDTSVIWDSGSYHGENIFSAIWSSFPISENYFRPFVVTSFAVDMMVFDNNPAYMHLHNLLVHTGSALLVGCLVAQFLYRFHRLDSFAFPVLGGIVFGLHPMLMEPAAWISGRFDAYVTFWLLLLLNIDLKISRLLWRTVLAFPLFLLAALSKEMAAVFPVLYLLIRMAYLQEQGSFCSRLTALRKDGSIAVFVVLVCSGFVYLLLRFSALGYLQQPYEPEIVRAHFGTILQHVLLVGKTAGTYLMYSIAGGAFTSPTHFQQFPISYQDLGAWCGFLLTAILLLFSIFLMRKGNRIGYVVPLFLVSLLPVLNIVFWPNTEDIVQERFLSLPIALMISMLFIVMAQAPVRHRKMTLILVTVFALVNGVITAATMSVWRNDISLWSWAVYRAPLSPYATLNLAVSYRNKGDQASAIKYSETANQLDPLLRMGDFTLASIAVDRKNYDEAIQIADRYLQRDGVTIEQRGDLLFMKASALHELKRNREAAVILEEIVRSSPHNAHFSMLLGNVLHEIGMEDRANACWVAALKMMPVSEAKKKFSDGQLHINDLQQMAGDAVCMRNGGK